MSKNIVRNCRKYRPGGEAPRRDEDEVAPGSQQCGAHGHEQGIDVRLAMNHRGGCNGTWIGLADLEVRRIGDHDIESPGRSNREGSGRPCARKASAWAITKSVASMRMFKRIPCRDSHHSVRYERTARRDAIKSASTSYATSSINSGIRSRAAMASTAAQHRTPAPAAGSSMRRRSPDAWSRPAMKSATNHRCQVQSVTFAMPVRLRDGIAFADTVGVHCRPLVRFGAWNHSAAKRR